MSEEHGPFLAELRRFTAALESDLRLPEAAARLVPRALRAERAASAWLVPESYASHFERFGVFPTALVRDLAYSAKRAELTSGGARGPGVEADALAYAERFLRVAFMEASDDEE